MTGLDKIIDKIRSDSADACSRIISDANKTAEEIASQAKAECEAMLEASRQADSEAEKKALELAFSSAQQRSRQGLLSLRIKAINDVIEETLYSLEHLPESEYFGALIRLIEMHAEPGKCELLMSAADISRKPVGFDEAAAAAAGKKGCELTVCPDAAKTAAGVVLKYGDIEIDCTFRALIDEHREEIKEKVNEVLF